MLAPSRTLTTLFLLLLVIPSGCATRLTSVIPSARQADLRQTPDGVVALFASAWNERNPAVLADLFTADFTLAGLVEGSEGAEAFHHSCRFHVMRMPCDPARGGGDFGAIEPARMTLEPWSPPPPDYPRIAETRWRRYVYCTLRIDEGRGPAQKAAWTRTLRRVATFCLVRGDSAAVSGAFAATRGAADSTHWWLESLAVEPPPGYPGSRHNPDRGFICGNGIGDFWWP
jgi:hypothetical protein